ncbi:DUF3754 family protein, putative (DUF3754) [Arabidopsis thaliana]|uniref:DUF3754 family protein, putative (DUF3754) n=1 Tax=Arabidopsis thaliana TaxID=3702 RepID=A0A1P8AXY3_ARATH|nr:DUF3754 family protein, putative (DUF3754) [Arabidopsis thaliana]ANM61467.1 DUF3754 family protein, putative (DUF3754) [Arabidopsis thaliana]|eukprot:NP_001323684.1 DUF3754 family protein, putative (DUF3754) [Arabidopsis thaliana]
MLSLRNLTTSFVALPSRSKPSSSPSLRRRLVRCRLTEAATFSPIDVVSGESERAVGSLTELKNGGGWKVEDELPSAEDGGEGGVEDDDSEEEEGISSIHVPREKYINVSKSDLVNGIVTKLLDSQDGGDADIFLLLSSCLDSILHAEHKRILEQMRADFVATQSLEEEELKNSEPRSVNGYEGLSFPLADGFDIWNFLISSGKHAKKRSAESVMAATRFQRSFIQLLDNAGFEELSARDLALTSALNTDYLLTLPVYVDWKKASESNAIVFRRGFATEKEKGLLLVEKLDYIQSKVLQVIFSTIAKPLRKVGKLINKALSEASQTQEIQDLSEGMKVWLKDLSLFKESYLDQTSDNFLKDGFLPDSVLPMQLAAQRAVSRYEGLLTPVGPRAKLFRKLLGWIGFISRDYETPSQLANDSSSSEPYLRPIFLSRMTLADIWKPASKKACGNDIWKRIKTSISILLSPSTLQVIFPHKKLYFRIIDTVRLDIASILGLTAYFVNYKFENISSSPSAFFLDVIAVTALVIYATRVVLGYKQTWDRYQLLVNKTLYEKTLASGFGSVHFLLDASEQQQYKEAILTYAIILQAGKNQNMSYKGVGDRCERFMYDTFKIKVEMRVEKAISTLVRLGLVTETLVDSNTKLQAVPCPQAYISLKELWSSLLG